MKAEICTFSGISFNLENPTPHEVCIEDVAHALSHICRFTGHTREFYSVAQHCVHVADYLKEQGHDRFTQLFGLLHDAHEAYVNDIATPMKILMPDYVTVEQRVQDTCEEAFGLIAAKDCVRADVAKADRTLLFTEARDIVGADTSKWSVTGIAWERHLVPWTPTKAKTEFLTRFEALSVKLHSSQPVYTV